MLSPSLQTNFFEKRVGDYQKSGVMAGVAGGQEIRAFTIDEDF